MNIVGAALEGLVGGFLFGLIGSGTGVAAIKALLDALDRKALADLTTWFVVIPLGLWFVFVTVFLFGLPIWYALDSPAGVSQEELLVKGGCYYVASFLFLRGLLDLAWAALTDSKRMRDQLNRLL